MSIAVSIERLRDEVARFGSTPYLLTVSDDGRAHATAVTVDWQGDELVMGVGGRSSRNVAVQPEVSLLWPPFEPGGYSLISDGVVRDIGNEQHGLRADAAVLHRPAAAGQRAERARASTAAPTACRDHAGVKRRGRCAGPQIPVESGFQSIVAVDLEVGHALSEDRQSLLQLRACEPRAEAVVDATAERQVR